ncbi:Ig domain protein group 1 domain protein [Nostoc sp. NIES-4103]|nr:Ig domain protein group 1 domain protein [Nostoc sp. NIES-4103]
MLYTKWQKPRNIARTISTIFLVGFSSSYFHLQLASACTQVYSLWSDSDRPTFADSDDKPVELGVKFRTDVDGEVTAIRFYRIVPIDSGYTVNLWSATGQLLGSGVAVEGQSPTPGWQTIQLYPPVPIKANQFYTASYYASKGRYTVTENFFNNTGVDSGPLHAPRDGEHGSTSVYTYSLGGGFPTQSYKGSNYWVDVKFQTTSSDH